MATLTFLPWKTIKSELDLGKYKLSPYTLGANTVLDQVLSNFQIASGSTIKSATIISVNGNEPTADQSQNEIESLIEFGELLSLCFLCNRRLFSDFDYTNYHSLRLFIQKFKPGSPGVSVNARRRDGEMLIYLNEHVSQTKADYHIVHEDRIELDTDFCTALIEYSQLEERPLLESVFLYLQANTDSSDVTPHSELVLICGAIESVLGIKNGNTTELIQAFLSSVEKVLRFDSEIQNSSKYIEAIKTKTHQKASYIREVWIKDFYITRGDIAHGRKVPQYASLWSLQEHIILASEVYPLLLKIKLQDLGLYKMTEDDLERLFLFDHRISISSIMKIDEEHHMPIFGWNKAVEDERFNWVWKKDDLIVK